MNFGNMHKRMVLYLFYENFEKQCEKMGKYPSVVVDELGFNKSVAAKWKKGVVPQIASRKKIADYFGITVEELMETKKEPAGQGGLDEQMQRIVDLLNGATQEERDAVETLLRSKVKKD